MHGSRFEMMLDHVRAIHRAVTGGDPPEPAPPPEHVQPPSVEAVTQQFANLEAFARSTPAIAERVPPFSFAPPVDIIGSEREIIVELGVFAVDRADVEIELAGDLLTISGARSTTLAIDGRVYFHAEMPRGPFRRVVRLPEPTSGPPRVEVDNGIVRVRLSRIAQDSRPRA
jgi:HSP20 family molecular chaperone IbpA